MAQAARLNLRMQKELKLLLTDPPPGASFPSLSDDSSASLTSIDANFKGPEGTVYDNGVFKIKIQIPERYPFQPPIVTFATPIYHPNIDTGGRICLDILNLPPKGSWQPSLNISTVLTSIGLLLSEPNPDDGLMHDASREYKYNRQAFDQKAKSMTDKYARAGESDSSFGCEDSQAQMCPSTSKTETKGSDASICETEKSISQKRFGSKMKLSLESLGSSSKHDSSKEMCEVPDYSYSKNHINSGQLYKATTIATAVDRNPDKQVVTKHKLSLKGPAVSRNGDDEINVPNHRSSTLATRDTSAECPDLVPLVQIGVNHVEVSNQDHDFTGKCIIVNQEIQSSESVKVSQRSWHPDGRLQRTVSANSHEVLPCSLSTSQNETNPQKDASGRNGSTNQEIQSLESVKVSQRSWHPDEKLQRTVSANAREVLPFSLSTSLNETNPQKGASGRKEGGSSIVKRQKVSVISARTSLEPVRHSHNDKENQGPDQPSRLKLSNWVNPKTEPASEKINRCNGRMGMQASSVAQDLSGKNARLLLEPVGGITGSKSNLKLHSDKPPSSPSKVLNKWDDAWLDEKQQVRQVNVAETMGEFKQHSICSPVPEATIVLDSEDSEDENVPVRSKLSLARKRLSLKRRHV